MAPVDLTAARSVLALSPHPDDVELCAGGTLAWLAKHGARVRVAQLSLLASFGAPGVALDSEHTAALSELGCEPAECRRFPVRLFGKWRQDVLDALIELRERIAPDVVLAPCGADTHQDHAVVHAEALRAFRGVTLLGYEAPWNMRSSSTALLVALSREHVDRKLAALGCYASQAHRPYFARDYQEAQLRVRGVQARATYAEAFEAITIISGGTC